MFVLGRLLFAILFYSTKSDEDDNTVIEFEIYPDTDPMMLGASGCQQRYPSCIRLAVPSIEKYKHEKFGTSLEGWGYSDLCGCSLPPQIPATKLQYLHIPKTGTSFNWLLHSYFEDCPVNETNPCSNYLDNVSDWSDALCNGRLLSCAGHRVSPNLPKIVLSNKASMITMLRHPWNRLQSDYHYLVSKPHSQHLGQEINTTHLLSSINSLYCYTQYPGVANCATKMLNGYQCGELVDMNDSHVIVAKQVLTAMLWFGITEYFNTSVCQFSWMYGGDPQALHFMKSRVGLYEYRAMVEAFNEEQQDMFLFSERFDLEVYEFALNLFLQRIKATECPIVDKQP